MKSPIGENDALERDHLAVEQEFAADDQRLRQRRLDVTLAGAKNFPARSSYPSNCILSGCINPAMQVGITGHQERHGIDWRWVETALETEIRKLSDVQAALSSLAKGADQLFANVAISLGIPVIAVIPVERYERFFHGPDRAEYDRLLQKSEVKELGWRGDDQSGFFLAGKFIVEESDLLFAVWDGEKSKGFGGTADVVDYAKQLSKRVIHLNPILQSVQVWTGEKNG